MNDLRLAIRPSLVPAIVLLGTTALVPVAGLSQTPGTGANVTALAPIVVQGQDASGPGNGVVAQDSTSGSKTDTPVLDLPVAVSVVTEDDIERRDASDIQQVLSYTAGVSVDEYGSDNRYDYFRIRGFLANGLGTYRDGLPNRTVDFTTTKLEPYGLQRVDVLKGSTSTLFGLNGPGGMVNAVTKRPTDYAFGEVYTTVGDDHLEVGTDFGAPLSPNLSYRVTAKAQDAHVTSEYQDDDRKYFAPALTWKPTDRTTLTVLGNFTEFKGDTGNSIPIGSGLDIDTYLGEPDFNSMNRTERSLGWLLEHDFGSGLTFRQAARYTNLDMLYQQVYYNDANPVTAPETRRTAFGLQGEMERFTIDNQLQYDTSFGTIQSRSLVGFDHTQDQVKEDQYRGSADPLDIYDPRFCGRDCVTFGAPTIFDQDQKVTGVYAQQELTFDDRWILTLGSRYDYIRTEGGYTATSDLVDEAVTSRAGLTLKATPDLAFYANYSESFQPPDIRPADGRGEPQEGEQFELGAKYRPTNTNALFSAAVFDLTQKNISSDIGNFVYRQIGEINVRGLELEAKLEMTDRLNVMFGYSYWDSEITRDGASGNEGNRPEEVPEHLASIWADYTLPANGRMNELTLGLGARFVGSNFADNANTTKIGSYAVVDAAIEYEVVKNTSIALNVSNLLDREYVATNNFNNTSSFYGDERTIRATLKRSW